MKGNRTKRNHHGPNNPFYKHGMYGTKIYKTWSSMMARCYIQSHTSYQNYGGRGITVEQKWHSFEKFFSDMRDGYSESLTLDRKDNNKNYSKSNCRWVTKAEQNKNKRNVILYKINGKKLTIPEISKIYKIGVDILRRRLKKGLTIKQSLVSKVKTS